MRISSKFFQGSNRNNKFRFGKSIAVADAGEEMWAHTAWLDGWTASLRTLMLRKKAAKARQWGKIGREKLTAFDTEKKLQGPHQYWRMF